MGYRIISDASLFKPLQSAAGRLNKQRQFCSIMRATWPHRCRARDCFKSKQIQRKKNQRTKAKEKVQRKKKKIQWKNQNQRTRTLDKIQRKKKKIQWNKKTSA